MAPPDPYQLGQQPPQPVMYPPGQAAAAEPHLPPSYGVNPPASFQSPNPPSQTNSPLPIPANRPVPIAQGSVMAVRDTDPNEVEDTDRLASPGVIRSAPPWLISLVIHMVVLIVAGFFLLPKVLSNQISVEVTYAEEMGEQLLDDAVLMVEEDFDEPAEPIVTPDDLVPVEDPFAAPPDVEISLNGTTSTSQIDAPAIGSALNGRSDGMKQTLLSLYGGDANTEAAVQRALEWFKRNQLNDGAWSLEGPYSTGGRENMTAATAMALLAFQGAGHTHTAGKYKNVVADGWRAMLSQQNVDGDFWQGGDAHHRLYSQAQATIAICELYGMTRDEKFRDPAQRAIDYAVRIQDEQGGWRYTPGKGSDTSVTGWFVMALQSGRMAGLDVDSAAVEKISRFLDSAADEGGSHYGYMSGTRGRLPLTAEGLLCRQYLGWKRDDPRMIAGANYVIDNPINFDNTNVYYWYYATQMAHHMEDEYWEKWNAVMRLEVPKHQIKQGKETGSWSPGNDRYGARGGRLYTTALCTYMLEVYYRHLPIYSEVYKYMR